MLVGEKQVQHDRVNVLGIGVDRVTMKDALGYVKTYIRSNESHIIVTADSSGLYNQLKDPELREIMLKADLVTPDSFGVIWAAKKFGKPIEKRVNGVELLDAICELSSREGYRLYFLGADRGVADRAAERLRLRHPGCNIVGTRHGFFPSSDDDVVAQEIASYKPDVLFVAMGIPRQEKFIAKTKDVIKAKVAIGVGGSFDVYSGNVKRAPKIIQKINLEWLWRLILNPKKLSKCATLPKFAMKVLKESRRAEK